MYQRPKPIALVSGHIAFVVEDVAKAHHAILAAGGTALGTIEKGVGTITVVYVRDPEGNIVELQRREAG